MPETAEVSGGALRKGLGHAGVRIPLSDNLLKRHPGAETNPSRHLLGSSMNSGNGSDTLLLSLWRL